MSLMKITLFRNMCSLDTYLWRSIRFKHERSLDSNSVDKFHDSVNQEEKGKVYDKKPFKFLCEKGKSYMWCACGHSKTQPFCDGTHKSPFLNIKLRPVRFVPDETKEYWFCNCKQTNKRPFCDGSHRNQDLNSQMKN